MKKLMMTIVIAGAYAASVFTSVHAQEKAVESAGQAEVIVVGAGSAGLTSAVSLAENGVEVILLEKEDIVGGKMYSPLLAGINCNLGTQYLFPGIHPMIDDYMKSLPLQQIEIRNYLWKGKLVGVSEKMSDIYPVPEGTEDVLTLAFQQMSIDLQLAAKGKEFFFDVEPENKAWNAIEKMNSGEYLSKFPEYVYDIINSELGAETGGDIKDLSAIVLVGWDGDGSPEKYLVKGGNQVLAEKMKEDFLKAGGRLYLNFEVTKIEQDKDSVKIECKNGRRFTADYAVVATPADIAAVIVKDLPGEKMEALEAVGYSYIREMGLHLKNFPATRDYAGILFIGEIINAIANQTGSILGKPDVGTVISLTITDPETLKLDEKTILKQTGELLKKISPEFDPESDILDYIIKIWDKGVSKWPAGFASKYQKALREPVGRIFFAGDYTGDPSLMGAVWSGSRAAEAIIHASKSGK